MSQGGDALGDLPEPIQREGIDRHAPQARQVLDAVILSVTVRVLPQKQIAYPVAAVLDGRAARAHAAMHPPAPARPPSRRPPVARPAHGNRGSPGR